MCSRLKSEKYKFVVAGKLDIENPDCISSAKLFNLHSRGIIEYIGEQKNMKVLYSSKISFCLRIMERGYLKY